MDKIWSYYKEMATETGKDPETGKPKPFSLEFFFSNTQPQEQNELVRAFLGDSTVRLTKTPPPSDDVIRQYTSCVPPLYDAQVQAISNALSYPISLVQGPPGTGKTEMILSLISVLLHLYPDKSIAVVSTNNEALNNISEKIRDGKGANPMLAAISERFAVLGKKKNIEAWRAARRALGEDVQAIDAESFKIDSAYLRQYPVFSSTVHSLRKIFLETNTFHNQFDFVIADECSQMSLMLGIVAMSCAKNLVLIGDNHQLPPVISANIKELSARHTNLSKEYKEAEGKSFLSLCEALFPDAPNVFLDQHYRCHPSIIGFCNKYVYNNSLTVATPDDGELRMRAVWYEGDYCEKISEPVSSADQSETTQIRRKIYNKRQIEIFIQEELPRLTEKLRDPDFSAAVLSPFRVQIEMLGQRLRQALAEMDLSNCDISDNLDEEDIPRLTIHKAQGKGFDVVYFLPVEDYYRENPWCQRKRMINVAVSRAKQEFCIITSSQWLPEALQQRLTGYVLPNREEDEPDEEGMYCRKLLRYIADNSQKAQGEFGFHRSKIVSIFDKVPRYRRIFSTTGEELLSAPARCAADALFKNFGEQYTILSELPLRAIEQTENADCTDTELLEYRENSRFDFALCEGNKVRLLLEVDGEQHRESDAHQAECDKRKDFWVNQILKEGDIFMRIPTDGSTANELASVRSHLENAGSALTVSDEVIDQNAAAAQAQYAIDLLREQLADKIDDSLANLREHFSRTDLDDEEKIAAVKMDFTHAETMTYSSSLRNSYYLCRYAVAYAFEYAMLYDLALRIRLANGDRSFSVFSFGAGSFLDAWSMAYAKARLMKKNPVYSNLNLYYKGVDEQAWGTYLVNPTRIYSGDGFMEHCSDAPVDQAIDDLFKKVWLYNWDVNQFLHDDILSRRNQNFYYNILVFPKIINELQDEDVERLVELLEEVNFTYDEYYLLVSHSKAKWRESAKILNRFIDAMNRDGDFEVCCDYEQLLGEEDAADFEKAWLGADSLVSLAEEEEDFSPLKCYAFNSAMETGESRTYNVDSYIDRHNKDFNYDAPREFLQKLNDETDLRANQVRKVNHIVFDVVRLKKREE